MIVADRGSRAYENETNTLEMKRSQQRRAQRCIPAASQPASRQPAGRHRERKQSTEQIVRGGCDVPWGEGGAEVNKRAARKEFAEWGLGAFTAPFIVIIAIALAPSGRVITSKPVMTSAACDWVEV